MLRAISKGNVGKINLDWELEKAIIAGHDAVGNFLREHPYARLSSHVLGTACRYAGADTVSLLIAHSRISGIQWDTPPEGGPYYLRLLPGCKRGELYSRRAMPGRDELIRTAYLLAAHGLADINELMFYAVLTRDFDIAEELKNGDAELSAKHKHLITGDCGYICTGSGTPEEAITRDERLFFQYALRTAPDEDFVRIIKTLTSFPGVDKVALFGSDLYTPAPRRGDPKVLQERLLRADMLPFVLEKTNLKEVAKNRVLLESLVRQKSAEGLRFLIDQGMFRRRPDIDLMMEIVGENAQAHPELYAAALAHKAENAPGQETHLAADTLAASVIRQAWRYASCCGGASVILLRYKGNSDNVAVPPRAGRRDVTEIADAAFPGRDRKKNSIVYKSVSFPGTIKRIPRCLGDGYDKADAEQILLGDSITHLVDQVFAGTSIETIRVPDSVTGTGSAAFSQCSNLREVHLPRHVEKLPFAVFEKCTSLRGIPDLPNLRYMGSYAFSGTGIESADLTGILEAGEGVFAGCRDLTEIKLPPNITRIPQRMLRQCASLEQIPPCTSLRSIGFDAFRESGLTSVHLPETMECMEDGAFDGCSRLESVRIDGFIEEIGQRCFRDCTGLRHVSLAGVRRIMPHAFQAIPTSDITLPENLEEIQTHAFATCTVIHTVNFPDSLRVIGPGAFAKSSLVSAQSTRAELGAGAFQDCRYLVSVKLGAGSVLNKDVFHGCTHMLTAHLPGIWPQYRKMLSRAANTWRGSQFRRVSGG